MRVELRQVLTFHYASLLGFLYVCNNVASREAVLIFILASSRLS